MTKRITSLIDDPTAASDVRELLQAARDARVTDYDFEAGLERHMTQVQTGAPLPDWAKGLEGGSGTGTAAVAGTSLVGWLALPIATVAVVAAVVLLRDPEPEPVKPAEAGAQVGAHEVGAHEVGGHEVAPAEPVSTAVPAAGAIDPVVPADARAGVPAGGPVAVSAPARTGETVRRPAAAQRRAQGSAKPVPAKRTGAAAGTRAGSTSSSGVTAVSGAKAQSGDLFDGSPVATATQADNATRSPSAARASTAQAEREAAAEVARDDRRSEAKPEPAAIDDTRLEREMGMLAVAQRVLHTDAARTLSLARQGESEFAGSMFTQERQQLELLALVKLGRLDEAKRLARPYLSRYPNGPFSDRVRRAVATGRVER